MVFVIILQAIAKEKGTCGGRDLREENGARVEGVGGRESGGGSKGFG